MSFDGSIETWMEAVYEASLDSEQDVENLSLEALAARVGSEIFARNIRTTADLASTVAEEMDIDITSLLPGLMNIAKLCLLFAVSSKCRKRAEYVQGIIALDPTVQGVLMQIIKSGIDACLVVDATEGDIEEEDVRKAPVESRKRAREDDESCRSCADKAREIVHLQATLRRAVEKEDEDSQHYHRELSLKDNKLMDVELQLIQRDEHIAELQQASEVYLSTVKEQQLEIEKHGELLNQIQDLQDEIDVLKPKAEKVDALEVTTERLKLKLDEMADLKQQLSAESSAHLKTQNKYVDIVREVDLLRKTKAQLDEYRATCAELEISSNELSIKLSKATRELENISGRNEHLSESQRDRTEETQRLMEELEAVQARLREVERSGGIGQGMSELNPELMMELTSLRSENDKLSRQLNMSSVESLEQLEKHLEHAKSINTSLQAKWMDTKDQLAESRAEANALSQSVADWSLRFQTLYNENAELICISNEDRISVLARQAELGRLSDDCHKQELAAAISMREAIINSTRMLLEETKDQLNDTCARLEDKIRCNGILVTDLEAAKCAIGNMESKIEALNKQHESDLCTLKDNHTAIVDLLKQNEIKKVEEINRRHNSTIQSKEIEISSMSSELEAEKKKRRRVEKEKRFLEGEVHRHKTQAQINSSTASGTSNDVGDILKEMKAMQKSLDHLTEENGYLKSLAQQGASLAETTAPSGDGLLKGGAGRVLPGSMQLRSKRSNFSERDATSTNGASASYGDYLEQTDISDKRMEQLVREKREIMTKNLEESKEKMEMAQKLLQSERENTQLKAKVTKLTLENERYQRKAMLGADKAKTLIARAVNEENKPNLLSNYPIVKKALL